MSYLRLRTVAFLGEGGDAGIQHSFPNPNLLTFPSFLRRQESRFFSCHSRHL